VKASTRLLGGTKTWTKKPREVETGAWVPYKLYKSSVKRVEEMEISNKRRTGSDINGTLLVSLHRNFPVVDIVDSHRDAGGAVIAYQVTWQDKHPFNMGALHDFRGKLKIKPSTMLKIFYVVPKHAEKYAAREKRQYCKDKSLNMSVDNNNEVWTNTSIYVLQPNDDCWTGAVECLLRRIQRKRARA
jgi:hypothetical protein